MNTTAGLGPAAGKVRDEQDRRILGELRADFAGWRIWRARRSSDGLPGEWLATLHDPQVGITPTVMERTPDELRAALLREANLAQAGHTHSYL
ncbi:hypothetical protein [Actinomadura sp. 6N118]|uniref:hypothetical protein n=1 Tax=Actinomadura sp. 6N118 TaxID=3375151 RepID=UPI003798299F